VAVPSPFTKGANSFKTKNGVFGTALEPFDRIMTGIFLLSLL
jgi:hypothetical protein